MIIYYKQADKTVIIIFYYYFFTGLLHIIKSTCVVTLIFLANFVHLPGDILFVFILKVTLLLTKHQLLYILCTFLRNVVQYTTKCGKSSPFYTANPMMWMKNV